MCPGNDPGDYNRQFPNFIRTAKVFVLELLKNYLPLVNKIMLGNDGQANKESAYSNCRNDNICPGNPRYRFDLLFIHHKGKYV